ncbi:MAG: precorrin-3B synthase [Corynebacterium sp.]|uniref:precorrin-3B synthase n=1 Tax=Corynebacterium sp. TaxID=1720 RepID=UPI0026DA8F13|nr:precorrin-3B synthase [Corynebacterium sp.]MDO5029025.1 precorrin-3B synthase [Corynebacterium sp.]
MTATDNGARTRQDGCPGSRKMHLAADGAIGRLRFPGGFLPAPGFEVLADLAENFGDGDIHFTSRGNVQIRGIKNSGAFADAAEEEKLVPSTSHDRVRNILQSPLSGRVGGKADVRELVQEFDKALIAEPTLATLPGRTLMALDDGRGDVLGERPDFGAVAHDDDTFELIIGGETSGLIVSRDDVVEALVATAKVWNDSRGTAWRIAEADAADRVAKEVEERLGDKVRRQDPTPAEKFDATAGLSRQIGWIDQPDGLVSLAAGLRFGVLPARLARAIAQTQVPVHITPWYSLILHDLEEEVAEQVVKVLAPNGLIFDRKSTWLRVTACTGRPGCVKSLADTRGDAAHAIAQDRLPDGRVHFSGCERRCGKPKGGYFDYLATGDGEYEVTAID